MNFTTKNKIELKDTLVPDIFITEYMPKMTTNSIKIYLYLLKENKNESQEINEKVVETELKLTPGQMYDAINELIKYGILDKSDDLYILKNLKEVEIERKYTLNIEKKRGKYESEKDKLRTDAIISISKSCFDGNMPSFWFTEISRMFQEHNFDEEVMFSLFEICKNKLTQAYVTKVADSWARAGVRNYEQLESYTKSYQDISKLENKLKKELRLNRSFIEEEFKMLTTWYNTYKFDEEIILYALKKAIGKNNPIQYIDKVLKSWYESKFKTINQIIASEQVATTVETDSDKSVVKVKKTQYKKDVSKGYEERQYAIADLNEFYN